MADTSEPATIAHPIDLTPELSGTVSFHRKVTVRPYETAEAFVAIQFPIPNTPDLTASERGQQIIAAAKEAFFQAKALVFEELGLEFEVDENGVVHELVRKTLGAVTDTASEPSETPSTVDVPDQPPYPADTRDKEQRKANTEWAKARFEVAPNEFWDNRPKKQSGGYSSKAPDLKHKATGLAVWLS